MTLTTHAVVGAAIASVIPQYPIIAFCAAFASHFVVDAIPHRDYPIRSSSVDPKVGASMKYDRALLTDAACIGVDALVGVALSVFLFATPQTLWLILACACAGILPDALQFLYAHFRHEPLLSLQHFHQWIHTSQRLPERPVFAIVSQAFFLAVVVFCAKVLSSFTGPF